jgi:branched-chain amino acid transport system permease protein
MVVSTAALVLLARSNWGLILRAIRGDEATCQAAGLNVTYYKIASLVISGAVAGAGGAMYAHYQLQVSPQVFTVVLTITVITMVYVGGMGSVWAPVGGAILLVMMTELLRDFGEWRLMVYSVTQILILFFLPEGFIGPTWGRLKARWGARRGARSS